MYQRCVLRSTRADDFASQSDPCVSVTKPKGSSVVIFCMFPRLIPFHRLGSMFIPVA